MENRFYVQLWGCSAVTPDREAAANMIQSTTAGRIWIIEGLVGPKNPNLDFMNVSASGFAIRQLCPVTFLSTLHTESRRNAWRFYAMILCSYIPRVYDPLNHGVPRIMRAFEIILD